MGLTPSGHFTYLFISRLLQLICSYLFWPVAFLMGCDYQDARRVAALIGTKTFLNEFVAYAGKLKLILFIV